jgi:hypothetical protein
MSVRYIVISKKDTQCPKENKPREYISDSVPTEVPDTSYYRRRIADGSLGPVVSEAETKLDPETKKTPKKGGK